MSIIKQDPDGSAPSEGAPDDGRRDGGASGADAIAAPDVFISYSSLNKAVADIVCDGLEREGLRCWIAPRDIRPGEEWGDAIVRGIRSVKVFVLIFSSHANSSNQIKREVERAVNRGIPIIPFRIENVPPAASMEYFISSTHWLDAFEPPIEKHAVYLARSVKALLSQAPPPPPPRKSRWPAVAVLAAAAVALAGLLALNIRRPSATIPSSPLAGRWKASLPDGRGGRSDCVLDVQKTSLARYSDDCPYPFSGAAGTFNVLKDATWAPALYQSGDGGTFLLQGGSLNGFAGAWRLGFFGGLTTRDPRLGTVNWSKTGEDKSPAEPGGGVAASATWPVSGVPAMAAAARAYVRSKWASDAVLMRLELDANGGMITGGRPSAAYTFYSPAKQAIQTYTPGSQAGALMGETAAEDQLSEAAPNAFLDLPDAIAAAHAKGLRGQTIDKAELYWTNGGCGSGNFRIDNAILPKCPPHNFTGVQWRIWSALGETVYVPATP